MKIKLHRFFKKKNIIRVLNLTEKDLENADVRTSLRLTRIMNLKNSKFRIQARLNLRRRKSNEYSNKECSNYLNMTLNLYELKSSAIKINKFLSQKQLYLRASFFVNINLEVVNSYVLNIALRTSLYDLLTDLITSINYVSRIVKKIRSDVIKMFNSLKKFECLSEMKANS